MRRLTAEEALDWGLVNRVVPAADLKAEVRAWADMMLQYSPTALKVLKQSFNVDTEQMISVGSMAFTTLNMFGETPEAKEGIAAFNEKHQPDFPLPRKLISVGPPHPWSGRTDPPHLEGPS